ncbi:limbic system-associated membrane protein-like isoform X2 [Lycorma delicatula]
MWRGARQLPVALHCLVGLILSLAAQPSQTEEDAALTGNLSSLLSFLSPEHDNFLHELNGFWSYNDTIDLSKYEDFDHSKFLERPVDRLEEVVRPTPRIAPPPPPPQPPRMANMDDPPPNMPVFDNNMVTNITAQLGGTAFLHCRVRMLGERPVSWVRRRDWHILTSGVLTYTNDERFQVVHSDNSDDWNLQIKYVQKRDNGTYECQVATGSGTISHYFNLHVVVPSAYILGSGEYHIGEGSTISLVCIIENSPQPPQYVFWYHNDRMINYDTARGGVTVSTEPGPKTHSRLIVNHATHADSGNYSCRASNTEQDTIYVYVSKEGDNTAAIQRQETSVTSRHAPSLLAAFFCLWISR